MDCCRPLALLLVLPISVVAQPSSSGVLDTGVVQFELFDNGELGAYADEDATSVGAGFVFGGLDALYEGTFLVGRSFAQVSGEAYELSIGVPVEWVPVSPVTAVTPPVGFDVAFRTVYEDAAAAGDGPINLEVTATALAREGDPFVYVQFEVENTSGGDLNDIYVGVFADWDVGPAFTQNLYGLNEDAQLAYCWDPTGANPNYYGVVALDPPVEDHVISGFCHDALPGDAVLFSCMTVIQTPPHGSDRRTVLAVGPFEIAVGEALSVPFAFVGGTDEADILANAEAAQGLVTNASEPPASASAATLHAPYPNPAQDAATISFTLVRPQPVRLSILDALGREVAVLVDDLHRAGDHRLTWDTAALPAGVYVARLYSEGVGLARRVVLTR